MRNHRARQTHIAIVLAVTTCIGFNACNHNTDARITGEFQTLPTELVGSWQVTGVLVDLSTSRTLKYQANDVRLLGKTFTIDSLNFLTNTPENDRCSAPSVYTWNTAPNLLMSKSFAGHGIPAKSPNASDYKFPIDTANNVQAYWIKCRTGSLGPAPLIDARALPDSVKVGTWVTMLPDHRLAMRWYDQTILLLTQSKGSSGA